MLDVFAIGMELTGTTLLKYSQGFTKLLPTIGCLVSYFICFFSFSRALNDLNLGLAYATWSASASCVCPHFLVPLRREAERLGHSRRRHDYYRVHYTERVRH